MSLRHKISRIWGQDTERPVTAHQKSSLEAKVQLAATPDAGAQPVVSPKTVRKAASTTFQAFSNSLRSKAQTFYTAPNQADGGPSGSLEPQTPKKSGHASTVWSSIRGRGSRKTQSVLKDTLGSLDAPETPTNTEHPSHKHTSDDHSSVYSEDDLPPIEYTPIGNVPPRISTEIPRSSFEHTLNDHDGDVTTPAVTPTKSESSKMYSRAFRYEPKQLWPSPHMRLRELTLAEQASPKVAQAEAAPLGLCNLSPTESQSAAIDAATVEQAVLSTVDGHDENPVPEPPASLQSAPKSPHNFESDRRSSKDYTGTFWPAGKVLKSSKRSSTEEGNGTSTEAGMGPRDPWDKAQADRRRRHAALHSMNTASGGDPDPDIEHLAVNCGTLLNDPDTPKDTSRELNQVTQHGPISSFLPPTQDTEVDGHLKADLEGSLEAFTTAMTKKIINSQSEAGPSGKPHLNDPETPPECVALLKLHTDLVLEDQRRRRESKDQLDQHGTSSSCPETQDTDLVEYLKAGLEGTMTKKFKAVPSIINKGIKVPTLLTPSLSEAGPSGKPHFYHTDTTLFESLKADLEGTMTKKVKAVPSINSLPAAGFFGKPVCNDPDAVGKQNKADLESSIHPWATGIITKAKAAPSCWPLHAEGSNTERPSSAPGVSTSNATCGETECPSSPEGNSNSAPYSSKDGFKTNDALKQKLQEPVACPMNPWRMLSYECSPGSSKTYDADESDTCNSSSDMSRKAESEFGSAAVKPWTSSCGKYARYTSTPPPGSPSSSPPYEVRKCYTKHYESTGRSGSPSDPVWLEAHHKRIEESISAISRKTMYSPNGEDNQQTMADDPRMLDLIMEIRRKGVKDALCQFIYRCEQEAEDEADAESSSESSLSDDSINMTEA
ncbi:MAG: hypothetical protein Q9226_000518 [Calogaya cf. arnoldii]